MQALNIENQSILRGNSSYLFIIFHKNFNKCIDLPTELIEEEKGDRKDYLQEMICYFLKELVVLPK